MSDDHGWDDSVDGPGDGGHPADLDASGSNGRVEAGVDSSLAPWETGTGKGGLGRAVGESVGVIVLALIAGVALALGGGLGLLLAGYSATSTPVLIASLVGTQAGFVAAVLGYLRWRDEPLSNVGLAVPDFKGVVLVVVGLVAAIGVLLVVAIVASLLSLESAENSATAGAESNPTVLLVLIPVMILVVGPCEELLFRGIVQRRLRERLSAPAAITLGAALFASIHFFALVGDLSAIATYIGILFFPSLVLGALYEYGKNVVVNALVHGFYNSVLLLISYAQATYVQESASAVALLSGVV